MLLALALLVAPGTTFAQENTAPPAEEEEMMEETEQAADVVATLASRGNFSVLIDALQQTGLAEQLKNADSVTLFAPTDDAFAALPEGSLEDLSVEELGSILQYHVAVGALPAQQAVEQGTAETMQGGTLTIKEGDSGVTVNGAAVAEADLQASNGVIHVIDAVLMPEMQESAQR